MKRCDARLKSYDTNVQRGIDLWSQRLWKIVVDESRLAASSVKNGRSDIR